jgi:hypothetical protein
MNRLLSDLLTLGKRRVVIAGSFAPNGTSAVDQTSIKGKGVASVARTSQGLFTITLNDVWGQLDSAIPGLQLATAAARKCQIGAVVLASKTIQIRIVDGSGAVQDAAADANNRVNFEFTFRYSANE